MIKILIVEDEKDLLSVLVERFTEEKFSVEVARDGGEAVPAVNKFMPDIVLLDLILPKKSGFDVLKELKADEKTKNIKVVVLSNLAEDENIKKAIKLGADDYFVKTQHPITECVEKVKAIALR